MIIYNGFEPGETRSSEHAPRKSDKGHSVVKTSRTRRGSDFSFRHAVYCECGARYTSRESITRAWSAHDRHKAKETGQ